MDVDVDKKSAIKNKVTNHIPRCTSWDTLGNEKQLLIITPGM